MRQMRKVDIHEILGITESLNDQNQTRELIGRLMTECNVHSFNSFNSRDNFRTALTRELTSPQTRLGPAILTAYSNDAEKCIQALYGLARLIRKSRGPPSTIQSPSGSASVSRLVSAFTSAASTPAPVPTFTPTPTNATATAAATASTMTSTPFNTNINILRTLTQTVSMTPSMTTSPATSDETPQPSTPENDAKYWLPDNTVWFLDLSNNAFARPLEFRLSDLVGIQTTQTARLLETTWVDSSALRFIRFANALSEGFQVPIFDLTKIEIWMQIDDPINKTSYEITVPADEGVFQHLEEAYHIILDDAMENAFMGVLPSMDSLDAYEITRSIFLGDGI